MKVTRWLVTPMVILCFAVLGNGSACLPSPEPRPVLLGVWRTDGAIFSFDIQENFVWIGEQALGTGRLVGIDVSDPTQSQEMSSSNVRGFTPADIDIGENYAYVVSYSLGNPIRFYFEVFDISNPLSPQRVGGLDFEEQGGFQAVAVKENVAYAFNNGPQRAIWVFDVSVPSNPIFVRSVMVRQEVGVFDIYIHNNLALLANAGLGVSVLDLEVPLNPVFLSTFEIEKGAVGGVSAKGQYVYFPRSPAPGEERSELFVLDARNSEQMEVVASLELGKRPNSNSSQDIALGGDLVAVTMASSPFHYVQLVDISDPFSPLEVGRADIPPELDHPQGSVAIHNNLVFASGSDGLAIYEIVYE